MHLCLPNPNPVLYLLYQPEFLNLLMPLDEFECMLLSKFYGLLVTITAVFCSVTKHMRSSQSDNTLALHPVLILKI